VSTAAETAKTEVAARAVGLSKVYGSGDARVVALNEVDLTFSPPPGMASSIAVTTAATRSVFHEPGPLPAHRMPRRTQLGRHVLVRRTRGAGQDDPAAQRPRLRRRTATHPPLQRRPLLSRFPILWLDRPVPAGVGRDGSAWWTSSASPERAPVTTSTCSGRLGRPGPITQPTGASFRLWMISSTIP